MLTTLLTLTLILPSDALAMTGTVVSPQVPDAVPIAGPPVTTVDPWHITADMRAWLEREVPRGGSEDQRMQHLLRALERRGLVYDDGATGTAAQVFTTRRFNCLGVAHLVVGLARAMGVHAVYVEVVRPRTFGQRGDLVLAASHVAAGWGPPAQLRVVEYGLEDGSRSRPLGRLDDEHARSLHYANRGAEMLVAGEPALARQWLAQALHFDDASNAAWVNLGVAERRLGRHAEAQSAYLQALALDPGDRSALQNLATLEHLSGNVSQAQSILQRLAKARHRNPLTYVALGDLHLRSGQLDQADRFYRRAVRLGPKSAPVLAARGQWHLADGNPSAAQRWLERAHAADPQHPRVRDLRAAITLAQ